METQITKTQNSDILSSDSDILKLYGAYYYYCDSPCVYESDPNQAYYFKTYIGEHKIDVCLGDSIYYISEDDQTAFVAKGPVSIVSKKCATIIRGFMASPITASLNESTVLPYVNGCSTRQIIYPQRLGDPTLQYLKIPAYSKEQAHHIHSTARVVYIRKGKGISIVGMEGRSTNSILEEGMVCILQPMCPHHFETPYNQHLEVVPLHVFSSVGHLESSHPMFNGTHLMNQG